MRPPLIQAPIYLAGAEPPPLGPAVREVCRKSAPLAGLVGATALAATAGYFAPKFFDWALSRWRGDERPAGDEIELEIE
jgi:hypothetical protein